MGLISRSELNLVLKVLDPVTWTDDKIDCLPNAADTNGNHELEFDEFSAWLFGETTESAILRDRWKLKDPNADDDDLLARWGIEVPLSRTVTRDDSTGGFETPAWLKDVPATPGF